MDALSAWKTKAREGTAEPTPLTKVYLPDYLKASDDDSARTVEFTITTQAVDRAGDSLAVDGWDTAAYMRNPVTLWAHDSTAPPIGKALSLAKTATALKATVQFTPPDLYPFGDFVFRMVKAGYLRATSVGFLPTEWTFDEKRGGFNFLKQQLLEFSVCPVPCNPEALVEAKRAGIDLAPLREWAEETLDGLSDEPGLWLPKSQVEAALKAAKPAVVVNVPAITVTAPDPDEKAGRVLSRANTDKLTAARDACTQAAEHVAAVLASAEKPDDEEEPMHEPMKAEPVLRIRPEPSEPRFPISKEELRAAVVGAIQAQVAAAIRQHTGRID